MLLSSQTSLEHLPNSRDQGDSGSQIIQRFRHRKLVSPVEQQLHRSSVLGAHSFRLPRYQQIKETIRVKDIQTSTKDIRSLSVEPAAKKNGYESRLEIITAETGMTKQTSRISLKPQSMHILPIKQSFVNQRIAGQRLCFQRNKGRLLKHAENQVSKSPVRLPPINQEELRASQIILKSALLGIDKVEQTEIFGRAPSRKIYFADIKIN